MSTVARDKAIKRRVVSGTMGSQGVFSTRPLVGFYGCAEIDRVVRVAPPQRRNMPRILTVNCPCGREHKVGLMWRQLKSGEELDAEVDVQD